MTELNRQVITAGAGWPAHDAFSPALRVANVVYLAGTTGAGDDGTIAAPGEIVERTRQILRSFERLRGHAPIEIAGAAVSRG
jgi:enamine deaminase RidA (YjgF/YER057c/UK114 family)